MHSLMSFEGYNVVFLQKLYVWMLKQCQIGIKVSKYSQSLYLSISDW